MLMSPVGLRPEKGCAGDARQKLKSTDPTSRQRGRPTSTNPKLSTTKDLEWEKLVADPRCVPDTKMDWPTDSVVI
jgi:hypothetical protein